MTAGVVRTVAGDIAPGGITGAILFHEHLLFDIVPPGLLGDRSAPIGMEDRWQIDRLSNVHPQNACQPRIDVAAQELAFLAEDGGGLLVDQTVFGLARNPTGLLEASERSGVPVVASAGTYTAPFLPEATLTLSAEALEVRFVAEIEEGLDGTSVRAGLIGEIGCSFPLHPFEQRALVAAAGAQRRTGVAVSVHPGRDRHACRGILDVLEDAGADLSRVILCHMDRTFPDGEGVLPLLARGAVLEWDFFGIETSHYWMDPSVALPTDRDRLRLIKTLADAGYGDNITISQDICTRTRMRHSGGHGYGHIPRNLPALMNRLGLSQALASALLCETPLRLLTFASEAP